MTTVSTASLGLKTSQNSPVLTTFGLLKMSYLIPHLHSGWAVDQAILSEQDRIVIIRFGRDWTPECMQMDEILAKIAEKIKNMAVIYLVSVFYLFPTSLRILHPSIWI